MRIPLLALALLSALPTVAEASFGLHAATHLGIGDMGSSSPTMPSRSVGTFDLQAMPGYRLFSQQLLIGLMLDYRFVSQLDNPSRAAGTDYTGSGLLMGIAAAYETNLVKILLGYDFRARHSHDLPETSLMGSGYRLQFSYKVFGPWGADLQYVHTNYNTMEAAGTESELNNYNFRHWNLGLGVSYSY